MIFPGFTFKRSIWGLYSGPLLFCLGSRPRALFCDAVAMFLLLPLKKDVESLVSRGCSVIQQPLSGSGLWL